MISAWTFAPLRAGAYDLIVADPPWRFRTWNETNQAKSASRHYRLMTTDAIKALPVASLAAPDCALLLWSTGAMQREAFACLDAWGFRYKQLGNSWAVNVARWIGERIDAALRRQREEAA